MLIQTARSKILIEITFDVRDIETYVYDKETGAME